MRNNKTPYTRLVSRFRGIDPLLQSAVKLPCLALPCLALPCLAGWVFTWMGCAHGPVEIVLKDSGVVHSTTEAGNEFHSIRGTKE